MEMNTRLQVEHPVTEAADRSTTWWSGSCASRHRVRCLPECSQEEILRRFESGGHAVEVRLCAEDPCSTAFLPQSRNDGCWLGSRAANLRVDHALTSGTAAKSRPFYDSMIAKLIAHGPTRAAARRQLLAGLHDTVALGLPTNQHFLQRCLAHPVFADGGATTAFIADHQDALLAADPQAAERALLLAALVLRLGGQQQPSSLAHRLPVPLRLSLDGAVHDLRITATGDACFAVEAGEGRHVVERVGQHGDTLQARIDGLQEHAVLWRDGPRLLLHYRGRPFDIEDRTLATAARTHAGSDGLLRASTTGRVVALLVAAGDAVAAGQPMLTLEAMKMEHVHCAPRAGRVAALHVGVGEQVAARHVVAEIAEA